MPLEVSSQSVVLDPLAASTPPSDGPPLHLLRDLHVHKYAPWFIISSTNYILKTIFNNFCLFQFGQPGASVSLPGHAQGGHNQSFQQQEFLRQQAEYKYESIWIVFKGYS